jgi:hypothetical protein
MRPPDHPPAGFVMPGVEGLNSGQKIDPGKLPDYANMTVNSAGLEPPADGRSVLPLLQNISLTISFQWAASAAEFQDMEGGLRRFADHVYDYTCGQFTIGRFDIYDNQANWDTANIHVLNISNYRANAQYGGLTYGGIIQVGRDAWGQPWNTDMGTVIFSHEFGHYGLFLPDEYTEATGATNCDNATANTCIMSNPYSEFQICTDESHDAQTTNDPNSCWAYMKYYYHDLVEVHGSPDIGPYASPGVTVTWHFPNLYVVPGELSVSPPSANEGENITVSMPVHNLERLVAGPVTVRFYLDSTSPEKAFQNVSLNIGGLDSATATVKWPAIGGNHTIVGVIDPDVRIQESTKTDNQASRAVVINSRPKILSGLAGFVSTEDAPITVKLTQYATDREDAQSSLKWTVVRYNNRAVSSVNYGANQTIAFNPVLHWWGITPVTLSVTDSGGLSAVRDINLTFLFVNYPPGAVDPSFAAPSALRGKSIGLSSGATDVEDTPDKLTPVFEWLPPGATEWKELNASYDGNRFTATVDVPLDVPVGRADARVAFIDSGLLQGDWTYLNASLGILNNRPAVTGMSLSARTVTRGDLLTLILNATDPEALAKDLRPSVEYRASEGDWRALDSQGEFRDSSFQFSIGVNASWRIGSYDLRALVNDSDGAASPWFVESSVLVVSDSFPGIDFAKISRTRLLRDGSALLTVEGGDYETPVANLTLEFKVRDSHGREENGYISAPAWNGTQWEAVFQPPLTATPGKFAISVRLGDADGGWSGWYDSIPSVDVGNNLPKAALSGPDMATAGSLIWFDASNSSDLENHLDAMSFSWNFGDGSEAGTGLRASHTYSRAGTYRVVLTLTDRDGATATAERTVAVGERPNPPGTAVSGNGGLLLYALLVVIIIGAVGAFVFFRMRNKGRKPPGPRASGPGPRSPDGMPPEAERTKTPADSPEHRTLYDQPNNNMDQAYYQESRSMNEAIDVQSEHYAQVDLESQPGPFPPPSPLPEPEPDPLRPADPDPGPGPYPEPEPDDDE